MNRLAESREGLAAWFEGRRIPVWLLGLVVSLFGWQLVFALPTTGLDISWWSGLYMANHEGLQWGSDIVFTYGPLGFMRFPWLWYSDLAVISFVYGTAVYIAFTTALIWNLKRQMSTPLACFIAFLMVTLVPGIDFALGLAVLWAFAVLNDAPPKHSFIGLVTVGAVFAAAESLMKLSTGPVIFGVLLVALIGARARPWQVAAYLATFSVSWMGFWLAAGQSIGSILDFLGYSLQIVAGYTEAMSVPAASSYALPLVLLVVVSVLIWSWFGKYEDRWARGAGLAIAAIVTTALYRQGVVRMDDAHLANFFSMAALLWIATPRAKELKPVLLTGVLILGMASVHFHSPGGGPGYDVIENIRRAGQEGKNLVDGERRQRLIDERHFAMQVSYALAPEILEQLEGQTVSVDPDETAVAWAYELEWNPLPVFQNYSAYTPGLDQLNSEALEGTSGPDRILRMASAENPAAPNSGLDGRYLGWDPPGQAIATLCNFEPAVTDGNWQVLSRVENRCGPETPISTIDAGFDEEVEVPDPGSDEVIFARVKGAGVSGLELLRSFFYKPRARHALTSDGRRYRLLGATAESGLLLRSGPEVDVGEGRFARIPQTETLELTGASGDLTYEFFRMPVASAPKGEG